METKQRPTREKCYAKAIFEDGNLPGYVRDISIKGCRIDVIDDLEFEPGEKKKITIIPEHSIGIGNVRGTFEMRWKRKEGMYYLTGSQIISVRDAESKKNYKALLQYYQKLSKDA